MNNMKTKDKQLGIPMDSKKKVTIVKCFICNQFFYSQITFDSHMKTHQSKLNRNVPQQIQRKTQQSFGINKRQSISKKNTTLQSISPNQLMQKKMNKTQKIEKSSKVVGQKIERPLSKQTVFTKKRQETKQRYQDLSQQKQSIQKEVEEINQALRQSSIIMNQIMFLTQFQAQQDQSEIIQVQRQTESDQQAQKQLSQKQFIEKMNQKDNLNLIQIQSMVLNTNFQSTSLQNCQIQLDHLRRLMEFTALHDQISRSKIIKIKSKILQQVIRQACANILNSRKSEGFKKQSQSQRMEQVIKIQNIQMRNCIQCYSAIKYGEQCILKGNACFHCECYDQFKK